jgi:hypothetical protein
MAQHVADDWCVVHDVSANCEFRGERGKHTLIFSPGGALSVQAMNPGASAEPITYTATKAIGAIATRAVPPLSEVLLLDGSRRLMQRGNGSLNQTNIRRLNLRMRIRWITPMARKPR